MLLENILSFGPFLRLTLKTKLPLRLSISRGYLNKLPIKDLQERNLENVPEIFPILFLWPRKVLSHLLAFEFGFVPPLFELRAPN